MMPIPFSFRFFHILCEKLAKNLFYLGGCMKKILLMWFSLFCFVWAAALRASHPTGSQIPIVQKYVQVMAHLGQESVRLDYPDTVNLLLPIFHRSFMGSVVDDENSTQTVVVNDLISLVDRLHRLRTGILTGGTPLTWEIEFIAEGASEREHASCCVMFHWKLSTGPVYLITAHLETYETRAGGIRICGITERVERQSL